MTSAPETGATEMRSGASQGIARRVLFQTNDQLAVKIDANFVESGFANELIEIGSGKTEIVLSSRAFTLPTQNFTVPV